ncbi:MAG: hypothetical protein ACJAWO_001335, partial [Halieaceae bacterium]
KFSGLTLDITFNQKVGFVTPEKWSGYLNAMDEVFSFYNQKIMFDYSFGV